MNAFGTSLPCRAAA